jgi:uncharacterized metal-binding protein
MGLNCVELGLKISGKVITGMRAELQIEINRQKYQDLQVKSFGFPDYFEVEIYSKYCKNNGILAQALLSKHQKIPIDFAMSLGINRADKSINQAMKSRGHYAFFICKK